MNRSMYVYLMGILMHYAQCRTSSQIGEKEYRCSQIGLVDLRNEGLSFGPPVRIFFAQAFLNTECISTPLRYFADINASIELSSVSRYVSDSRIHVIFLTLQIKHPLMVGINLLKIKSPLILVWNDKRINCVPSSPLLNRWNCKIGGVRIAMAKITFPHDKLQLYINLLIPLNHWFLIMKYCKRDSCAKISRIVSTKPDKSTGERFQMSKFWRKDGKINCRVNVMKGIPTHIRWKDAKVFSCFFANI